jgi:hypothetical protein
VTGVQTCALPISLTIKIKNRPILLKNILELFEKEPELKKINQITSKN